METSKFHKILAAVLSVVVLISTTSFTVNMHYCGTKLVDVAINHEANACQMEMPRSTDGTCSITKKGCCENKQLSVEAQDELQLVKVSLDKEVYNFEQAVVQAYLNLFEGLETHIVPFEEYPPPLLTSDRHKVYEVYLI